MINGLVDALKSLKTIIYNNNLAVNSLNARNFLVTLEDIDCRL